MNAEHESNKATFRFWKRHEFTKFGHRRRRKSSAGTMTTKNSDDLPSDVHDMERRRHGLVTAFSRLSLNGFGVKARPRTETPINEPPTTQEPFHPLPVEIQLKIVCNLSFVDLLSLRRTSKHFNELIMAHEAAIVRDQLRTKVPSNITKLYSPSGPDECTLQYLGGLAHRQMVSARLAGFVAEYIARELFRRKSARSRKAFASQEERLQKKMTPMLFTLFHHFEKFREAYVKHLLNHDSPMRPVDWEQETLKVYSSHDLVRAYMMYSFLCHSFALRLRPPTYAGRLERAVRGWTRPRPSEESLTRLIIVGGLREVMRIWSIKNYNDRLERLDAWTVGLFSRRNGAVGSVNFEHGPPGSRSIMNRVDWWHKEKRWNIPTLIEKPMPTLRRKELDYLLAHLPPLWEIWYPAAERELIDRRVVRMAEEIPDARRFVNELMRIDDQPGELDIGPDTEFERDVDVDRDDDDADSNGWWPSLDEMMGWRIWMPPDYEWP